jgi:hypothetical protein
MSLLFPEFLERSKYSRDNLFGLLATKIGVDRLATIIFARLTMPARRLLSIERERDTKVEIGGLVFESLMELPDITPHS